jgi:hypothetical protein
MNDDGVSPRRGACNSASRWAPAFLLFAALGVLRRRMHARTQVASGRASTEKMVGIAEIEPRLRHQRRRQVS